MGRFADLAARLIGGFPTPATLRRTNAAGTYDPETGSASAGTTDYSVTVSPPSPVRLSRYQGDTLIQVGDLECILANKALAVEPSQTTDSLVVLGAMYRLIRVEPIPEPGGIAAYRLIARR